MLISAFLVSLLFILLMTFYIPGVNFPIWVLLYSVGLMLLIFRISHREEKTDKSSKKATLKNISILLLPSIILSMLLLYRTNYYMLAITPVLSILSLYIFPALGRLDITWLGSVKIASSFISLPISWLKDSYAYLKRPSSKRSVRSAKDINQTGVLSGLLLSIPFLIIFSILFYIGDTSFSSLLGGVGETLRDLISFIDFDQIDPGELLARVIIGAILFILSLPVIFISLTGGSALKSIDSRIENMMSGLKRDVSTGKWIAFLVPIVLLFLLFLIAQFNYLFAGVENIVGEEAKYTFSEYARRGFVELSLVIFIVCGILMFLGVKVKDIGKKGLRFDRIFVGTLVILTGLLSFSALSRIFLLIDTYGLTNTRLFGLVFLLMLMVALVLYFIGYLKERSLSWYNKVSGILLFILLGVFLLLPTDLIVGASLIHRFEKTGQLDYSYILSLSEEAQIYVAPKLLDHFDEKGAPIQTWLINKSYEEKLNTLNSLDPRSYNITRAMLRSQLNDRADIIQNRDEEVIDVSKQFVEDYSELLTNGDFESAFKQYWSPAMEYRKPSLSKDTVLMGISLDEEGMKVSMKNQFYEHLTIEIPTQIKIRLVDEDREVCLPDMLILRMEGDEVKVFMSRFFLLGRETEFQDIEMVDMLYELENERVIDYQECKF